MIRQILKLLSGDAVRRELLGKTQMFDNIVGYEGIKRTFLRSLNSKDPVHILLVGPPGQAKTLFLKSILKAYGEQKAFFTVGGNASKSGMIDEIRQTQLKTWVFATSNGTKRLSEPLLSRFRVMYVNQYDFAQFYEISTNKLLDEGLSEYAADEIAKSVWEQLPSPNVRNCVQIGRLVKNESNIERAIAEEIQNFKEYAKQEPNGYRGYKDRSSGF
jgi:MoxR-like ATPase